MLILIVTKGAGLIVTGYPTMQFYLNKTGHPMVFSCEWPLYENNKKIKVGLLTQSHRCVRMSTTELISAG